jgi:hypothetical protein
MENAALITWQQFRRDMMTRHRPFVIAAVLLVLVSCGPAPQETSRFPELTGEYLGQKPPGAEPELFAPGIISTGMYTRDIAMTPDGQEIYFSVVLGNYDFFTIMETKLVDGRWTEPRIAPFSGKYMDLEPHISPDGERFFFFSRRPLTGDGPPKEDSDIWVMERSENGWGEPRNLGAPVNSEISEYFPSVTRDGTIYFSRDGENGASYIYRSRLVDGSYMEPEKLGPEINSTAAQYNSFIAPDESYIIFGAHGRDDGLGGSDYYISFRRPDGRWEGPFNMGNKVNSESPHEYSPYVSPDGKYFFFMASRSRFKEGLPEGVQTYSDLRKLHGEPMNGMPDIYWVDASFIEDLRP